jgi:hypothetical protein
MTIHLAKLDQINIVSPIPKPRWPSTAASGMEIPEQRVWRTATGAHHITAQRGDFDVDIDSTAFAQIWNRRLERARRSRRPGRRRLSRGIARRRGRSL